MTKSPITKTGAERLREQLHELKTVERPRITAATLLALTALENSIIHSSSTL